VSYIRNNYSNPDFFTQSNTAKGAVGLINSVAKKAQGFGYIPLAL
jgi:hypothetical protein